MEQRLFLLCVAHKDPQTHPQVGDERGTGDGHHLRGIGPHRRVDQKRTEDSRPFKISRSTRVFSPPARPNRSTCLGKRSRSKTCCSLWRGRTKPGVSSISFLRSSNVSIMYKSFQISV